MFPVSQATMSSREDGQQGTADDAHDDPLIPALPVEEHDGNGEVDDEELEIRRMHAQLMATFEAMPETFETDMDLGGVSVRAHLNFGRASPASLEDLSRTMYKFCERMVTLNREAAARLEAERESARFELECEALQAACEAMEANHKVAQAKHDDLVTTLAFLRNIYGDLDQLQSEGLEERDNSGRRYHDDGGAWVDKMVAWAKRSTGV